ncbi:MAG: T9SS type A sorting domain-containing protein, partial [Candidatus Krumholzibacteria bacterium]|nr:T9SS type A sorting domain-containing protein [Candidatus Krumholzibacteria bacterium]
QNYPNPFNPETVIHYSLSNPGVVPVSLHIYDIAGRRVATLVDGEIGPGAYQATWHGRNDDGLGVPSGVYFSRLTVGDRSMSRKLLFLK